MGRFTNPLLTIYKRAVLLWYERFRLYWLRRVT